MGTCPGGLWDYGEGFHEPRDRDKVNASEQRGVIQAGQYEEYTELSAIVPGQ